MKARFETHVTVSDEGMARNIAHCRTLGLPHVKHPGSWHEQPLAVIGSGPGVADHVDELRGWPGDRWAINKGFLWCGENGIRSAFMTADPIAWDISFLEPGTKALLASCCDPSLFEAARNCDVEVFDIEPGGVVPLSTSASCAATLGPLMGYRRVVFFGCESSFASPARTNVNSQGHIDGLMYIRVGAETFTTTPPLLIQAELMAAAICAFPAILAERSGGLLGALVRSSGDYDVTAWGEGIALQSLEEAA